VLLTVEDVRLLARACSNRAPTGIRNRALVLLLHCGGLRISEALALSWSGLDFVGNSITLDGQAARTVSLTPSTALEVERWMKFRVDRGLVCDPLFCTLGQKPLNQAYVRQLLPRLAQKAGVNKPVNASALRDAYVASLIINGVEPDTIQQFLGYQTGDSTVRYMNKVKTLMRQIETEYDR
jgi:integrase/recombinase XerD